MEIIDIFHKLNSEFDFLYKNQFTVQLIHLLSVFLINIVSYFYIFAKFYKVLCYSKMTFEWLPMINPYIWPFSVFNVLTAPYFSFWARIFPSIRFENSSFEISGVVALESLNSVTYFCVRFTNYLIEVLEETEKTLRLDLELEN
jgi:hypothetical protein